MQLNGHTTDQNAPPLEVVVVEDHDLVRDELVAFLSNLNVHVRGVDSGEAMDTALRQFPADIVVLDLNLPGEDGLSICHRMREAYPDIGIVMLTARLMPSDKTAGYQHGADVYLTKPANVGELEAVVANLSRRIRRRAASGLQLDMSRLQLALPQGTVVKLTLMEARLLYELAIAPDRKLSTESLLQRLDPRQDMMPQLRTNLPVSISRLRQKIQASEAQMANTDTIKAVRGYGYQLTQTIILQV